MFERYTEAARLTMFHARAIAAKAGSAYVETGHLLLGLLEADPNPAPSFLKSQAAIDSLRKQLQPPPAAAASSTSVDIPLSHESKRALAYAAEEAERLHDPHISAAHLLMGLLREEQGVAAQALRERGGRVEALRADRSQAATLAQDLHRLVDRLPPERMQSAAQLLQALVSTPPPEPVGGLFGRLTEKARRVVFFARYEAAQLGTPMIEPEHLLLGVLREDRHLANAFLKSPPEVEAIRKEIEGHATARPKVSVSMDLPMSAGSRQALAAAKQEADALGHAHAGTAHLLCGLLRSDDWVVELLTRRGVTLEAVRQHARSAAIDGRMPR